MPDSSDESERKRQSREVEEVHRAVAQHIGLGDEPLDRKRKKLVKGRLMDLITGEDVPSAVVVAATEDIVIDNYDASKKCKEAKGAQDSIDEDDKDDDDDDDDTSSSSLVDDHGDDDSDDIGCNFQQRVKMKIAHNQARLTQLELYDNLETKKTIKMKSAQRSLAPNGPRRRNPVRSTRDNELINASPSNEPNNASSSNESINLDERFFFDQHNDECEVCGEPGLLLCCATCNLVSHTHCAGLQEEPISKWMCAYCLGQQTGLSEALLVEDHEDNKEDIDCDEEMTNESNVNANVNDSAFNDAENDSDDFNDAENDSDAPVAAELGPNDVLIGIHHSKSRSHPGNMRATELALQYYKEYCVTKSYVVKRALVTNLIQRLVNEGHIFLMKRGNEWMTMSDDQTHVKFSKMMTNLNSNKEWAGRVKVKPAMIVKLNKSKWNDNDRKILQEYVIENDDDDFCMWDHIATMLNRSVRACKSQMRKILDCGIYVEEKEGELIVFLYCFNIEINCLICGVLCA